MALLIGIDLATKAPKVGVATARHTARGLRDWSVRRGTNGDDTVPWLAGLVTELVSDADDVVLAIDAPLGWPQAMQEGLPKIPGATIAVTDPDHFFQRETDRATRALLGRGVLEVGANLIARTAFTALALLEALRREDERWTVMSERAPGPRRVLEVYPYGTAHQLLPEAERKPLLTGYKGASDKARAQRTKLHAALTEAVTGLPALPATDHELDALLCCLGASRYLEGECHSPSREQQPAADREGWIWI